MSRLILSLSGVGKCYASYSSNLFRFASWLGASVRPRSEFWAVKDISFALREGEALALIGQNGAGKSTLLKMIAGTIRATTGQIAVAGRINAILELGLGFNPEFTGRENAYQAGGFMGFSREALDRLMPGIESFAELDSFFDKPLRMYSSGMQARLAFAIATAERPDILIVDEVLSVGDSYFQHKSFDRIRRFKEEGCAILFVTHGMEDVRALCERVILIDKGAMLKDGPPDEVVAYYNSLIAEKENAKLSIEQKRRKDGWLYSRSGGGQATILSVALLDAVTQEEIKTARVGQKLSLRIDVRANERIDHLVIGCMLRDRTGHVVWGTNTWHTNQATQQLLPGQTITLRINFACALGVGSYGLSVALHASDTHLDSNYEWTDNLIVFDVINIDFPTFIGTTHLDCTIECTQ